MPSVVKSKKYIEMIDLTEEDDIKEELSMKINQSSSSHCTCNILIENQVSLY